MRRKLTTAASVLSMLLFLATVVLWMRSYWVVDSVWVGTSPFPTTNGWRGIVHWKVRLGYGDIYIERAFHESWNDSYLHSVSQSGSVSEISDTGQMVNRYSPRELGYGKEEWNDSLRTYHLSYIAFPFWWPTALFGLDLLPAVLRQRQRRALRARNCGGGKAGA